MNSFNVRQVKVRPKLAFDQGAASSALEFTHHTLQ